MDVQFWIWLAIIAVSFIARALKKKPADTDDPQKPYKQEPSGPVSFEDLLKEIQASKAPKPTPKPIPVKSLENTDYREVVIQEQGKLEQIKPMYVPSERANEIYEKARMEAFTRPSLEETMKVEDTVVRYDRLKGYGLQEPSVGFDLGQELNDVGRLKRAFVLNEVLMRKF